MSLTVATANTEYLINTIYIRLASKQETRSASTFQHLPSAQVSIFPRLGPPGAALENSHHFQQCTRAPEGKHSEEKRERKTSLATTTLHDQTDLCADKRITRQGSFHQLYHLLCLTSFLTEVTWQVTSKYCPCSNSPL